MWLRWARLTLRWAARTATLYRLCPLHEDNFQRCITIKEITNRIHWVHIYQVSSTIRRLVAMSLRSGCNCRSRPSSSSKSDVWFPVRRTRIRCKVIDNNRLSAFNFATAPRTGTSGPLGLLQKSTILLINTPHRKFLSTTRIPANFEDKECITNDRKAPTWCPCHFLRIFCTIET